MKRLALAVLLWCAGATPCVMAHDHGPAPIEIVQPWAPAMASGQDTQLVYLTIRNRANLPDRLKRALLEHQTFKLALEFDVGGRIVVDVVVGPPAQPDSHRH